MAVIAYQITDHGINLGLYLNLRVGPMILAAQLHPKLSLTSDNHRSKARRGEVKLSASLLALARGRYDKTDQECVQLRWKKIPLMRLNSCTPQWVNKTSVRHQLKL